MSSTVSSQSSPEPASTARAAAEAAGGFVGWLVETAASLAFGLIIGGVAVVVMHLVHKILPKKKGEAAEAH